MTRMPERLAPEMVDRHGDVEQALIRIDGVSKSFDSRTGHVHALTHVDLEISQGEFVSVVGPSGCGKSTLMMMIAGLYHTSAGEIRIHGKAISQPYENLGVVFQKDALMDWRTVLGNVLVQADFRKLRVRDHRERALTLLESVGLEGFVDKYPFELSGGMRQRVAICRALLHDPDLILMDEPFGALDALTREKMNIDLQELWQGSGKTVLFITHSITEAVFLSDRVIVMTPRPGRVKETIDIDLPRPRDIEIQEKAQFGRYVGRIHELFKEMGVFD